VIRLALDLQGHDRFDALPSRSTLRRWAQLALDRPGRLTLRFVDAREGRRLNRNFRGRNYATNVLTFGYERAPIVFADIVLCMPVIRREAREQRKTLRAHLAHMLVHGVLHARGHDHLGAREAHRMEALETRILARLRIANPYRDASNSGQ
jgi:probable rRNA maturation factor